MAFDPRSEIGLAYLSYVENRARVWAEKYLDGREPDYRGDAVLARYHFCNVWRELDRYSRWEIAQIRGRPLQEQLDIIVIGRMTMVPATIARLLAGDTRSEMKTFVRARQAAGLPWYNGALQMSVSCPGRGFMDEFVDHRDSYFRRRRDVLEAARAASDAQAFARALPPLLRRVGPFRAYEAATSLTYSEHVSFDEDQLSIIGPGAVDGYNLLTGARLEGCTGLSDDARPALVAMRDSVRAALEERGAMRWIPPGRQGSPRTRRHHKFTVRTLEDSLCEFRKYWSITSGRTRARRTHRDMGCVDA